jgi:hypothetical protein
MSDLTKPPANKLYDEDKWKKKPAQAKVGDKYRKWTAPAESMTVGDLAELVFTDDEEWDEGLMGEFNFATQTNFPLGSSSEYVLWYLVNYAHFQVDDDEIRAGQGSWLWVPADAVVKKGQLGPLESKPAPPRPPPGPRKPPPPAARSQQNGPPALNTINRTFLPGDVLLAEHLTDTFIQEMTHTWPTHVGICVDPPYDAVDAMPDRGSHAVAYTKIMTEFFKEKTTPGGGLVYRYCPDKKNGTGGEKFGLKAADWAKKQVGNEYHFTLKSPIFGEGRSRLRLDFKVDEKKFDSGGKAVDSHDQPLKMIHPTKGEIDKYHEIYCAELVWRAYHFGAGVNLVDPKKFFYMYADPDCAMVGLIPFDSQKVKEGLSNRWAKLITKSAKMAQLVLIAVMRLKYPGYLCAPHQFLQSKLLKKVYEIPPSEDSWLKDELSKHKVHSYTGANIHPLDVVENSRNLAIFEKWLETKATACYTTSVTHPLELTKVEEPDP